MLLPTHVGARAQWGVKTQASDVVTEELFLVVLLLLVSPMSPVPGTHVRVLCLIVWRTKRRAQGINVHKGVQTHSLSWTSLEDL